MIFLARKKHRYTKLAFTWPDPVDFLDYTKNLIFGDFFWQKSMIYHTSGRAVSWPRKAQMLHNTVYFLLLLSAHPSFSIKGSHSVQGRLSDGWIEHSRQLSEPYAIRATQFLSLRGGAGSLASMFSDTGELLYDPSRCGGHFQCKALQ
jgi:hypothetical protein